jgi:hypothetical protein
MDELEDNDGVYDLDLSNNAPKSNTIIRVSKWVSNKVFPSFFDRGCKFGVPFSKLKTLKVFLVPLVFTNKNYTKNLNKKWTVQITIIHMVIFHMCILACINI